MEVLADALQLLREERTHAQDQVKKLDEAISAIEGIVGTRKLGTASRGPIRTSTQRKRTLSPAARRKIAVAQRARWAKVRAKSKAA